MRKVGETRKLSYELITRSVSGDEDALESILEIYDGYINTMALHRQKLPNGNSVLEIDEDIKIQIQLRLVDAIKNKWRELI